MSTVHFSGRSSLSSTASNQNQARESDSARPSRHLRQLIEFNQDIFRRNVLTDVEILVEGSVFKSHRSVLICFSPYLRRKLLSIDGEPLADKVIIPKVGCDEFEILLRYMYTGSLEVNCNIFYDVFKAASFLEMKEVKQECLQLLSDKEEQLRSYFFVYVMSKKTGNQANWFKSFNLIAHRFEEAVFSKEFMQLEADFAIEILSAQQIGARSEIIVFLGGLNWLNFDFMARGIFAVSVMECVRFTTMDMEEIIACYHPPFLSQIMHIPEITMMMFKATCYVTAKSLGQDCWFKQYAGPKRVLTLQGMPMDLWNKGDPPESHAIDPMMLWAELNSEEIRDPSKPFGPPWDPEPEWAQKSDRTRYLPLPRDSTTSRTQYLQDLNPSQEEQLLQREKLLQEAKILQEEEKTRRASFEDLVTPAERDESGSSFPPKAFSYPKCELDMTESNEVDKFKSDSGSGGTYPLKSCSHQKAWNLESDTSEQNGLSKPSKDGGLDSAQPGAAVATPSLDSDYYRTALAERKMSREKVSESRESATKSKGPRKGQAETTSGVSPTGERGAAQRSPSLPTKHRPDSDASGRSRSTSRGDLTEAAADEILSALRSSESSNPLLILRRVTVELGRATSRDEDLGRMVWSDVLSRIESLDSGMLDGQRGSDLDGLDKEADAVLMVEVLGTLDSHCESHSHAAETIKRVLQEMDQSQLRTFVKKKKKMRMSDSDDILAKRYSPEDQRRLSSDSSWTKTKRYSSVQPLRTSDRGNCHARTYTREDQGRMSDSGGSQGKKSSSEERNIFSEAFRRSVARLNDQIQLNHSNSQELLQKHSATHRRRATSVAEARTQDRNESQNSYMETEILDWSDEPEVKEVIDKLAHHSESRAEAVGILKGVVNQIGRCRSNLNLYPEKREISNLDATLTDLQKKESGLLGPRVSEEAVEEVVSALPDRGQNRKTAVEVLRKVVDTLIESEDVEGLQSTSSSHEKSKGSILRGTQPLINYAAMMIPTNRFKQTSEDRHITADRDPTFDRDVRQVIRTLSHQTDSRSNALEILRHVVSEVMILNTTTSASPPLHDRTMHKWSSVLDELQRIEQAEPLVVKEHVVRDCVQEVLNVLPDQGHRMPEAMDTLSKVVVQLGKVKFGNEAQASQPALWLRVAKALQENPCEDEPILRKHITLADSNRPSLSQSPPTDDGSQSSGKTPSAVEDDVQPVLRALTKHSASRSNAIEVLRRVVKEVGVFPKPSTSRDSKAMRTIDEALVELQRLERGQAVCGQVSKESVEEVFLAMPHQGRDLCSTIETLKKVVDVLGQPDSHFFQPSPKGDSKKDQLKQAISSQTRPPYHTPSSSKPVDERILDEISGLDPHVETVVTILSDQSHNRSQAIEILRRVVSLMGQSGHCLDQRDSLHEALNELQTMGSDYSLVRAVSEETIEEVMRYLPHHHHHRNQAMEMLRKVIHALSGRKSFGQFELSQRDKWKSVMKNVRKSLPLRSQSVPQDAPRLLEGPSFGKSFSAFVSERANSLSPGSSPDVKGHVQKLLQVLSNCSESPAEATQTLKEAVKTMSKQLAPGRSTAKTWGVVLRDLEDIEPDGVRKSPVRDGRVEAVIETLPDTKEHHLKAVQVLKTATMILGEAKEQCVASRSPGKWSWRDSVKESQDAFPSRHQSQPSEKVDSGIKTSPFRKSLDVFLKEREVSRETCGSIPPILMTVDHAKDVLQLLSKQNQTPSQAVQTLKQAVKTMSGRLSEVPGSSPNRVWGPILKDLQSIEEPDNVRQARVSQNHVSEVIGSLPEQSRNQVRAIEVLKTVTDTIVKAKDRCPEDTAPRIFWANAVQIALETPKSSRYKSVPNAVLNKEHARVRFFSAPSEDHKPLEDNCIQKSLQTYLDKKDGSSSPRLTPTIMNHVKEVMRVLSKTGSPTAVVQTLKEAVKTMSKRLSSGAGPSTGPMKMWDIILNDLRNIEDDHVIQGPVPQEHVDEVIDAMPEPRRDQMKTLAILEVVTEIVGKAKDHCVFPSQKKALRSRGSGSSAQDHTGSVTDKERSYSDRFSRQTSQAERKDSPSSKRPSSVSDGEIKEVFQVLVHQSESPLDAVEVLGDVVERIRKSVAPQLELMTEWEDVLQDIQRAQPEKGRRQSQVTVHAVSEVLRSLEDSSESETQAVDIVRGLASRLHQSISPDPSTPSWPASSWELLLSHSDSYTEPQTSTHKAARQYQPTTVSPLLMKTSSDDFLDAIASKASKKAAPEQETREDQDKPKDRKSSEEFFFDGVPFQMQARRHKRSASFGTFPSVEDDAFETDKSVRSSSSLSFTEAFQASKNQNAKKPQILVIGGMNPKNVNKIGIGIMVLNFDPKKDKWTRYSSLPEPRHNHCACYYNNCIYVVGGCDPRETAEQKRYVPLSTCYKLDMRSHKWTQVASMCFRRMEHGLAKMNGTLYAVGGQDENERLLKSVETYEPKKNKWKLLPSEMCCGRKAMGIATYVNRIWLAGGLVQHDHEMNLQAVAHVDCYDPKEKKWYFNLHVLPSPRCYCSLALCGSCLYVAAGIRRRNEPCDETFCFNNDAKTWNEAPALPAARLGSVALAHGQTLIVLGGFEPSGETSAKNVHFLTPGALDWKAAAPLPTRLYGFAALSVH